LRLLLDTHFVIMLSDAPDRISLRERDQIFAETADIAVSAASIWEIRLKWQSLHPSGSRKLDLHPAGALALMSALGFALLPITPAVAAMRLQTPITHRDPFDELLLAHAQAETMQLLTRDRLLQGHPQALFVE
jgi:PIN domain nuclease of toxin-antitoxin system